MYFNTPPTIRIDPWKNKTRHRPLSVHLETKYIVIKSTQDMTSLEIISHPIYNHNSWT